MTLIYWAVGWLAGIGVASSLSLSTPLWAALGLLGIAAAILLGRHPSFLPPIIVFTAVCCGAARFNLAQPIIDAGHVAFYNGREAAVSGLVSKPPDLHETFQNLTVESEQILLAENGAHAVQGKVLLRTQRWPLIEYGTRIRASGTLEEPQNMAAFDYVRYLAGRRIYATMDGHAVEVQSTQEGNPLMHGLAALRGRAQRAINTLLPQPQAALLSGVLLGDEHAIPSDLKADFRDTGMTHIIAISGFNMAIIAGALLNGGRQIVGPRKAAWIALTGIVLYTLFVGAEASVVRAAVMAALFIVAATLLGRPTFLPAALLGAAFFMTLLNPYILWDVGFQLSFAATMGLMLYVGPWQKGIQNRLAPLLGAEESKAPTRFIAEIFLTTMAALIMTLPLMLYHFDTLSLVSPLANLLILPAQPGIMSFGGAATLLGMLSPLLGQLPAWIAWLLLSYTIGLVRAFASLTPATLSISLSPAGLAACYLLIAAATRLLRGSRGTEETLPGRKPATRMRRTGLLGLLTVAILGMSWVWQRPDGNLHVAFLDVGQGDAILIQGPDGKQLLVDGGQYPSLLLSRIGEQMPFWDKEIDLVVATHPDVDHVGGLIDLFERYDVGQIVTNGANTDSGAGYYGFVAAAEQANTPVHVARAGETITFGQDVRIEILHAGALPGSSADNDASVVMRLVYADFSLLLTGDAGQTAEQMLLKNGQDVQAAVLKAGHHGSNTASSREFLRAVDPQIVVISAGGERYGHPHEETLGRIAETGAAVWRTDQQGTIELISDGKMIWSAADHGRDELP